MTRIIRQLLIRVTGVHPWLNFTTRIEFGDLLLLVYLAVIVRQWFWFMDRRGWSITIVLTIPLWFYYVATKTDYDTRSPVSFWFIVGLPLLFAYSLRFPFADSSFDVWGVRLFHGERGLQGYIYWPGEFFPTNAPFNPTPDMITAIFRQLLGYRLGTIVNLLALVWTAQLVEKILRPFVTRGWLRSGAVLLIVVAEHLLFEINNYMPDLLALPLMLDATRITLKPNEPDLVIRRILRVAFLIGMATAIKLSNASIAIPLVLIWLWRFVEYGNKHRDWKKLGATVVGSIALVFLQILPFSVWLYKLTGSPVFPLYNKIFNSPLFPPYMGWDGRWGGYGFFEIVLWPIIIFFKPERTAEIGYYSGRLSVGFIAAMICLILARRLNPTTRMIAFIILPSTLMWSISMGYIRYALYLEVLCGVLLVLVAIPLLKSLSGKFVANRATVIVGVLIVQILVVQSVLASYYVRYHEWSIRPTVFDQPERYKLQLTHVLRDRTIQPLLDQREKVLFEGVEVWISSGMKTVGLMPFLNSRAKVMGVRAEGLFLTPESRATFDRDIKNLEGKRMASFTTGVDYLESLLALRRVGLTPGSAEHVAIPIFSRDDLLGVYFFEVKPDIPRLKPERTVLTEPVPEDAFKATITAASLDSPGSQLLLPAPGWTKTCFFNVKNTSNATWQSQPNGDLQFVMRARWLSADGTQIGKAFESALPFDMTPGESTTLALDITTPSQSGDYTLEVDMVQRGGPTFESKGSTPLKISHKI